MSNGKPSSVAPDEDTDATTKWLMPPKLCFASSCRGLIDFVLKLVALTLFAWLTFVADLTWILVTVLAMCLFFYFLDILLSYYDRWSRKQARSNICVVLMFKVLGLAQRAVETVKGRLKDAVVGSSDMTKPEPIDDALVADAPTVNMLTLALALRQDEMGAGGLYWLPLGVILTQIAVATALCIFVFQLQHEQQQTMRGSFENSTKGLDLLDPETWCSNTADPIPRVIMSAIGVIYLVRTTLNIQNFTLGLLKVARAGGCGRAWGHSVVDAAILGGPFEMFIYILNLWFVFYTEAPEDMILNMLAMEFVMQLDDEVKERLLAMHGDALVAAIRRLYVTPDGKRDTFVTSMEESHILRLLKYIVVLFGWLASFSSVAMIVLGPLCKI